LSYVPLSHLSVGSFHRNQARRERRPSLFFVRLAFWLALWFFWSPSTSRNARAGGPIDPLRLRHKTDLLRVLVIAVAQAPEVQLHNLASDHLPVVRRNLSQRPAVRQTADEYTVAIGIGIDIGPDRNPRHRLGNSIGFGHGYRLRGDRNRVLDLEIVQRVFQL